MTGATLVSVVREVTGVTGVTGVTEVSGTMWMTEHERSDGWTDGQDRPIEAVQEDLADLES